MVQISTYEVTLLKYWSIKKIVHLKQLEFKKSLRVSNRLPDITFCFNFYKKPVCHALTNALDMSTNTPQKSGLLSNNLYIS